MHVHAPAEGPSAIKLRMDEELHQALRLLAALARDDYAKLQAQYDDYVFNGYDNPRTSDPPPVVLHRADIGISSVVRALVADACRNPAASIKRITELHRLQAD